MEAVQLSEEMLKTIETFQRNEITEYVIYSRLARSIKDGENRQVLQRIADDEQEHYNFWKQYTHKDIRANRWLVFKFFWIARLFGLTFGIKLMEKGEESAQEEYRRVAETIPEAQAVVEDEDRHEQELLTLIKEEKLQYIGSVVLGLNDALVELTGALAGLSFALQNTRLTALAGLITGIAASFSMAASEYLSTKADEDHHTALKSSLYTGTAYIVTVILLVLPYLLFNHYLVCLGITIGVAILIIFVFNYYIAVARDLDFKKRFTEMALISLGVAAFSFAIGYVIRLALAIDI
jgi:VIT1/CCC1 family predicted Fe2+/Mn2+ transporter